MGQDPELWHISYALPATCRCSILLDVSGLAFPISSAFSLASCDLLPDTDYSVVPITMQEIKMSTQNEIREKITRTIIEALESGGLPPWRQPWLNDPNGGSPANVVSKKRYRGINPLLLQIASMRHGFQSKWWATFRQWDSMGGKVMRRPDNVEPGQWGTTIVFWKPFQVVEEDDGKETEKTVFVMRTYVVFNVDQVDGECLDHLRVGHSLPDTDYIARYENADRVIEATGADIRYGGNQAFYNRREDYIQIPLREQFTGPEYYETVFHEMIHWSEHPTRLDWNRKENGYAMGELVAEMGSMFVASEIRIPIAETLPNHVSYLQNWLKAMHDDHKFIFQASTQASRAADFVLSFSRAEQPEEEVLAD
jgi:antirestriction protein ArdC